MLLNITLKMLIDDLNYCLEYVIEDDLEDDRGDVPKDVLKDDLEDYLKLEGPAEKIGVTAAVTQLDNALSSLNIQRSDPSTNWLQIFFKVNKIPYGIYVEVYFRSSCLSVLFFVHIGEGVPYPMEKEVA